MLRDLCYVKRSEILSRALIFTIRFKFNYNTLDSPKGISFRLTISALEATLSKPALQ